MYKYDAAKNEWGYQYPLPVATARVSSMQSDANSLYFISGLGNANVYQFTPGATVPIIQVGNTSLLATVKKGETATTGVSVMNNGTAPLTGTVEVAAGAAA